MLEAAENASNSVDFRNIVKKEKSPSAAKQKAAENVANEDYIDDSEAPPLE